MSSSNPRRLAGVGLLLAALGIVLQAAGGADYPTVPPGLVILALAGVLVLAVRQLWALILAAVVTLFICVGGVVTPNLRDQLGDTGHLLTLVGSAVQVVGLLVALVALAAAIRTELAGGRRPSRSA